MPKKQNKNENKNDSRKYSWYFLTTVIIIYIITAITNPEKTQQSIQYVINIIKRIIPIIILVITFMGISNYLLKPKQVTKYVGEESGITGYIIATITGIISHGPIYVWYTLLGNLQNKGMKNGLIAVFLYNRAIKIPLLPMLIYYFGLKYSIILLLTMMITSIIQGILIDTIIKKPQNQNKKTQQTN